MLYYNGRKCLLRLFPTSLTYITLQTYRDGVDVSSRSVSTSTVSFENQYYECDGNEAVLRDCSQKSRQCGSGLRTYLTCKGKLSFIFTQYFRLDFCHYQSVETNNFQLSHFKYVIMNNSISLNSSIVCSSSAFKD